jgi:hypothetical protein
VVRCGARRHQRKKLDIERQKRLIARLETRERQALEKAMGRDKRLVRELGGKARHDFTAARKINSNNNPDNNRTWI